MFVRDVGQASMNASAASFIGYSSARDVPSMWVTPGSGIGCDRVPTVARAGRYLAGQPTLVQRGASKCNFKERRRPIVVKPDHAKTHREAIMARGVLLWLIGIPIPIIILLLLFLD
jgi:hypothetical protein